VKPTRIVKRSSGCSDLARRGDWGQRAPTDQSGTWETPCGESQLNTLRESITGGWPQGESERPILARTRGNARTSEGASRRMCFDQRRTMETRLVMPTTEDEPEEYPDP